MDFLKNPLEIRKQQGNLRRLEDISGLIDFCSNDYLGFARSSELELAIKNECAQYKTSLGSSGSRLISGNSKYYENLESQIAAFHNAESGLIFNSGYDANLGLFESILSRHDTVLYDELIHASVRDGIRLSKAKNFSFRHNDISSLESKIKYATGTVFVAVESLYSMDGDIAPLEEMIELSKRYQFYLIVDEAHASGIFGKNGEGIVSQLGLEHQIFARVHTFGKAIGVHGAIVLGSQLLKEFLLNFSRSFIYSTALPLHSLISISQAYKKLPTATQERESLNKNIKYFREKCLARGMLSVSESPIQSILISENKKLASIQAEAFKSGLAVKSVLHPTVPRGKERIRICLHSFNSIPEIERLLELLN